MQAGVYPWWEAAQGLSEPAGPEGPPTRARRHSRFNSDGETHGDSEIDKGDRASERRWSERERVREVRDGERRRETAVAVGGRRGRE